MVGLVVVDLVLIYAMVCLVVVGLGPNIAVVGLDVMDLEPQCRLLLAVGFDEAGSVTVLSLIITCSLPFRSFVHFHGIVARIHLFTILIDKLDMSGFLVCGCSSSSS